MGSNFIDRLTTWGGEKGTLVCILNEVVLS